MIQSEVTVAWQPLQEFAQEVFTKVGMPPGDAQTEAEVMVSANLRGVDSHGVQLLPWYVEAVEIGHMKAKPDIRIEKETPATLLIEADHAFGAVVTTFAMQKAMAKARETGIGWASIRRTNHQGAMGYYPLMAAEQGMAGIAWVCSNTGMAPWGAKFPGVGNSPIAISVPAKKHRPLILDMATSVAAAGKLFVAKDKGISIPDGWVLDKDGKPTTDPWQAAIMLPVGGPKGSGLSIMLECLTSVMVEFPKLEPVLQGKEPPFGMGNMIGNPDRIRRHIQNSTVIAIDIGQFTDVESYKEHIDSLIDGLKALPKADGFDEIFVPGEPEWRAYEQRLEQGISLPEKTAANLRSVAGRLGVSPPSGL
jgi:ureidoglycolate dehydrogenase (NAD+)